MKAIAIATLCLAGQEASCRVEMSFGADNLYLGASLIQGLLNGISLGDVRTTNLCNVTSHRLGQNRSKAPIIIRRNFHETE
jgi:hypothetical protein